MTAQEYNESVDNYADNIYRFALKHLRNESVAQDIVQETFTKVWEKHENVQSEKIKSYLFSTAYHAIVDWAKKENRQRDAAIEDKDLSSVHQENFDVQDILNEALETLPEQQKTVVLLRDYEGYSYAEIADICKLNESQVKVYIFRARKSLQQYLKSAELIV